VGLVALLGGCAAPPQSATSIGVYSGRHYNTDKDLYRRFTERTGIRVNLLEGKDNALIERLASEGAGSPADVLVLVDAARLEKATAMGLFQPVRSTLLERDVPAHLRDPQGRWFALTRRVLVGTYADLARPELKGKLCLRDSRSVYNQSLVADQMILRGEPATAAWVKGMVANVKQPFFTSDTPLARAVAKGDCGVGLVNSYYVARMLSGDGGADDKAHAARLKVRFPDPAHVNISGAGVTRHSRRAEAATRLIEFLASPSGGKGYAEANHEYPLRGFGDDPVLKQLGPFREDSVSVGQMGAKNAPAVQLMQAGGWQ
jgi:iron(III) transport system substrate-binding protein